MDNHQLPRESDTTGNQTRGSRGRVAPFPVLLLLAILVAWATDASAQDIAASGAQFVFVIDDSGSMGRDSRGGESWGKAADPDRLAVLAIRSLVSMLDDRDWVSVVALNAEEPPLRLRPLKENRLKVESLLAIPGKIAEYTGANTPCMDALERVKELLQDAYRVGQPQVILFLTDGECNGGRVVTSRFLDDLRSHRDGLFQFYFLTFQGRQASRELRELAARTGGDVLEVEGGRPADILHAFATALSNSQGYEGRLIDDVDPQLPAYRGAERVRLLAMVKEEGKAITRLGLRGESGGREITLEAKEPKRHQYGHGDVYHYVAGSYKPTTETVGVDVTGADRWKLVALPDYRLTVDLEAFAGQCDTGGTEVDGALKVGQDLCLTVELARQSSGDPQPVGSEVTAGQIEGEVVMTLAATGEESVVVGKAVGDLARFVVQRRTMDEGDYSFRPVVRIRRPSGTEMVLRGERWPLQVVSQTIAPVPSRLDFERVYPGTSRRFDDFRLEGRFPAAEGRLGISGGDLPACVSLRVGSAGAGESLRIAPDQPYPVILEAERDCGPKAAAPEPVSFELRLVFGRPDLPDVSVPVSMTFDNTVRTVDESEISLASGQFHDLVGEDGRGIAVPGSSQVAESFEIRFSPGPSWPRELEFGFLGEGVEPTLMRRGGELVQERDFAAAEDRLPPMRIQARPCCASGRYGGDLLLTPRGSGQAVRVPLRVNVEYQWWPCRRPLAIAVASGLLLFALLSYAGNMYFSSQFLPIDQMAARLVPLRWDDLGGVQPNTKSQQQVERLLKKALSPRKRAVAWLKANPLVFGLPKRSYEETVEMILVPHNDVNRSLVRLTSERDVYRRIQDDPASARGKLFARALGSTVQFFGVPGRGYRYGRLVSTRHVDQAESGEDPKVKIETLKRREKLLDPIPQREREEGLGAGWQVG